jgi:hypothetical protein
MADDNENFMDWAKPVESQADISGKQAAIFLREMCKAIDESEKRFLKVFSIKKQELKEFLEIETDAKLINVGWSQLQFIIADKNSIDYLEFRVEITDLSGIRVIFPGGNTSGHIIQNGTYEKIENEECVEYKIVGKNFEVTAVVFK